MIKHVQFGNKYFLSALFPPHDSSMKKQHYPHLTEERTEPWVAYMKLLHSK